MTITITDNPATLEMPSGKTSNDENFPVGSALIRPALRPHIHAYYRFARIADDIADHPDLEPEDKLARLRRFGSVLDDKSGSQDADAPAAAALRRSLQHTGIDPQHSHDLLQAFSQDATKRRYRDFAELYHYCRYSAMPVGRYVLALHGESEATWPPSDALCSALQILNHIQDCVKDYNALDRIYLPLDMLEDAGSSIADLSQPRLTPSLRAMIDRLLDETDRLIATGGDLPGLIKDRRLRAETAAIVRLAARLSRRLRNGDMIARRIKLSRSDFAISGLGGLLAALFKPVRVHPAARDGAR